jgi:hypothetical protein
MPSTVSQKTVISETEGQLVTYTATGVWDCVNQDWLPGQVVAIRNTLLGALAPDRELATGEIPKDTPIEQYQLLNAFTPKDAKTSYKLDMASGSRTHGRFLFNQKPIGGYYFGDGKDEWKRIIYGSVAHTGCDRLLYRELTYLVVDDERRNPETGEPEDDAINGRNWKTGDCHGKISLNIHQLLGGNTSLQFRLGLFKQWVAKGTLSYSSELDGTEYDLVIPLSCFKGKKPELGPHQGKVLFGVVFEAEERVAKPGWMLWQWISWDVLEADSIIAKLENKCQKLASCWNDVKVLSEFLKSELDQLEATVTDANQLEADLAYVDSCIKVISADKNGVMLMHPYIVMKLRERFREMWKTLATSAGVRFFSLMCMPDQYFEKYDKQGEKRFCAGSYPPGEYIVFCNPMRHWGDVQLWRNVHEGNFASEYGVIATTRELLLSLGRDTDGDFMQLITARKYPNLADAIRGFPQSPIVDKLPKVALSGNLQQIAIRSMNDATGIVASLLGKARSLNCELHYLLIPAGGEQKTALNMRIIDFLSQELQIAVDSLKSAYPNNMNGLNAVRDYLKSLGGEPAPWISDLKEADCYLTRPCAVDVNAVDTVSRIVKLVNSYWKAPDLKSDTSPQAYKSVLFSDVNITQNMEFLAKNQREWYRLAMRKAITQKELTNDNSPVRSVVIQARRAFELLVENEGGTARDWATAYWRVCHEAETGTASLVFICCINEIVAELENVKTSEYIEVYGVQFGKWSLKRQNRWQGQKVNITARLDAEKKMVIDMTWLGHETLGHEILGLVATKSQANVYPGWSANGWSIWSLRCENDNKGKAVHTPNDQVKSVLLFHPDVDEEKIRAILKSKNLFAFD